MEEHFIMMKRNFNIVLIKHIIFLSLNGYENVHVILNQILYTVKPYVGDYIEWSVYTGDYIEWSVYTGDYIEWSVYTGDYIEWSVYTGDYIEWSVYTGFWFIVFGLFMFQLRKIYCTSFGPRQLKCIK